MCQGKSSNMEGFLCILEDNSSLASVNNPKCFLSNFCFFWPFRRPVYFWKAMNSQEMSCCIAVKIEAWMKPLWVLHWSLRAAVFLKHKGAFGHMKGLGWGLLQRFYISFWRMQIFACHDDRESPQSSEELGQKGQQGWGSGQLLSYAVHTSTCPRWPPGGCQPAAAVEMHESVTCSLGWDPQIMSHVQQQGQSVQSMPLPSALRTQTVPKQHHCTGIVSSRNLNYFFPCDGLFCIKSAPWHMWTCPFPISFNHFSMTSAVTSPGGTTAGPGLIIPMSGGSASSLECSQCCITLIVIPSSPLYTVRISLAKCHMCWHPFAMDPFAADLKKSIWLHNKNLKKDPLRPLEKLLARLSAEGQLSNRHSLDGWEHIQVVNKDHTQLFS